jgi:peptide/nickel transport system permease protein
MTEDVLLRVRSLDVALTSQRDTKLLSAVSFDLRAGEIVGLAGETGSGKSLTALAIAQLLPRSMHVTAQSLYFSGRELLGLSRRQLAEHLGPRLAMVFQNPMSSLNPCLRIGGQLSEAARAHSKITRRAAKELAVTSLQDVRIPDAGARLSDYPHQFSGGMQQRVMIAMGLIREPLLIIADEPTTALDVTAQAQVVALLQQINKELGTAVLLISHDIPLLSLACGRLIVMYAGRIVEDIPMTASEPAHPYTQALIAAVPDMATPRDKPLATIEGKIPEPGERAAGCSFYPRCPQAMEKCLHEPPPLDVVAEGHRVACWRVTR